MVVAMVYHMVVVMVVVLEVVMVVVVVLMVALVVVVPHLQLGGLLEVAQPAPVDDPLGLAADLLPGGLVQLQPRVPADNQIQQQKKNIKK